jgi:hypothetical protein
LLRIADDHQARTARFQKQPPKDAALEGVGILELIDDCKVVLLTDRGGDRIGRRVVLGIEAHGHTFDDVVEADRSALPLQFPKALPHAVDRHDRQATAQGLGVRLFFRQHTGHLTEIGEQSMSAFGAIAAHQLKDPALPFNCSVAVETGGAKDKGKPVGENRRPVFALHFAEDVLA